MKKRLSFCLMIALTLAALAIEPTSRNPIPDPTLMLESDSYSIAVLELRADDQAVKDALGAAWKSLTSGEVKLPPSMSDFQSYLDGNTQTDVIFGALPFQGVRVDRMTAAGTAPTYGVTLSGWRGIQVTAYNALVKGSDGKAYPSDFYRRTDLVKRPDGVLSKVNGTFLFTDTVDAAKKVIDRLMPADKPVPPAAGALLAALKAQPNTPDAYGVALNVKGSFDALLKSANPTYVQKVRDKVGSARMDKAIANTKQVVWSVNLISVDRAEGTAVVTMANPAAVADCVAMLEEGKANLDATKVTDVSIAGAGTTVTVKCAVINLKQNILDMIGTTPK